MSQQEQQQENKGLVPFLSMVNLPFENIAEKITTAVTEGHVDPVQMYIALKRMNKVLELTIDSSKGNKELKELFKSSVRKTLDGGKSVDMFGANLRMQASGTTYDFEPSKHSVLNEWYKIAAEAKEAIDKLETEIKAVLPPDSNKLGIQSKKVIQEGIPYIAWTEDEFEETIFAPIKKQGESIVVTFKKQK